MSILFDEGQLAIANGARRVLEARVEMAQLLPLLEAQGEYHAAYWDTAKEQGWTAVALREAYGGLDLGLVDLGLIALETGRTGTDRADPRTRQRYRPAPRYPCHRCAKSLR